MSYVSVWFFSRVVLGRCGRLLHFPCALTLFSPESCAFLAVCDVASVFSCPSSCTAHSLPSLSRPHRCVSRRGAQRCHAHAEPGQQGPLPPVRPASMSALCRSIRCVATRCLPVLWQHANAFVGRSMCERTRCGPRGMSCCECVHALTDSRVSLSCTCVHAQCDFGEQPGRHRVEDAPRGRETGRQGSLHNHSPPIVCCQCQCPSPSFQPSGSCLACPASCGILLVPAACPIPIR